mgnify:CR=1 FL=1
MQFIAKERDEVSVAGIVPSFCTILVGQLCGFDLSVLWDLSRMNICLLRVGIALLWSNYQRGIQDLA